MGLILKLHHWRGDPGAGGLGVPPGLAFLTWPSGGSRAREDGWLVDMDVVATDRTPTDYATLLRFARLAQVHGRAVSWD